MDSWLRRLVVVVVALAAMVLLVPLTASAHEGHHSGRAVTTLSEATQVSDAMGVHAPARRAVASIEEHQLPDHDGACKDGCCFGMGCCGATIVSEIPSLTPPLGGPSTVSHTGPSLFSASIFALLEPPKPFA